MIHQRELVIPPIAANDPKGGEILRVWIAAGGLHVSLAAENWKDPAAWGIAMADIVRHLADAYAQTQQLNKNETLNRIKSGILAELHSPTDEPTGGFI